MGKFYNFEYKIYNYWPMQDVILEFIVRDAHTNEVLHTKDIDVPEELLEDVAIKLLEAKRKIDREKTIIEKLNKGKGDVQKSNNQGS